MTTLSVGNPAVWHVNRTHPGLLGTEYVIEQAVPDIDAAPRFLAPTAAIAAQKCLSAGFVHASSLV